MKEPSEKRNIPSETVWRQLVRAADSTSNNLIEADDGSSAKDFLAKMGIALREANSEAGQLSAIFATIILKMRSRFEEEQRRSAKPR